MPGASTGQHSAGRVSQRANNFAQGFVKRYRAEAGARPEPPSAPLTGTAGLHEIMAARKRVQALRKGK